MGRKLVYQPAVQHDGPDREKVEQGLYRPVKTRLTIRLDADIVARFKAMAREDEQARGYQTLINKALRQYLEGAHRD